MANRFCSSGETELGTGILFAGTERDGRVSWPKAIVDSSDTTTPQAIHRIIFVFILRLVETIIRSTIQRV
jgi:hypothetical protein